MFHRKIVLYALKLLKRTFFQKFSIHATVKPIDMKKKIKNLNHGRGNREAKRK